MKLEYGMLFLCLVGLVAAVSAVPPLPYEFYGTATLDGQPVSQGTIIVAKLNETALGSINVTADGTYGGAETFDKRLVVNTGEDTIGKTLTFWIGDRQAAQTVTLRAGESQELNLLFEEGKEATIDASLASKPDMGTPELPATPAPTGAPLISAPFLALLVTALLAVAFRRT